MLLLTHLTGCSWFYLSTLENKNWYSKYEINEYNTISKYILSLYWAISTICTVGFGDIVPVNNIEKIFNMIWLTIGVAFYSYSIGITFNMI